MKKPVGTKTFINSEICPSLIVGDKQLFLTHFQLNFDWFYYKNDFLKMLEYNPKGHWADEKINGAKNSHHFGNVSFYYVGDEQIFIKSL